MEKAIKKAIEGGWDDSRYKAFFSEGVRMWHESAFLDPLFWQALGKSMGWQTENKTHFPQGIGWQYYWHRFIDHLAEGKDADSFFANLLK